MSEDRQALMQLAATRRGFRWEEGNASFRRCPDGWECVCDWGESGTFATLEEAQRFATAAQDLGQKRLAISRAEWRAEKAAAKAARRRKQEAEKAAWSAPDLVALLEADLTDEATRRILGDRLIDIGREEEAALCHDLAQPIEVRTIPGGRPDRQVMPIPLAELEEKVPCQLCQMAIGEEEQFPYEGGEGFLCHDCYSYDEEETEREAQREAEGQCRITRPFVPVPGFSGDSEEDYDHEQCRHQCTNYDELTRGLTGHGQDITTELAIRNRIDALISEEIQRQCTMRIAAAKKPAKKAPARRRKGVD